jgi:alkyl hydroperoxide reductase subunit AhpC
MNNDACFYDFLHGFWNCSDSVVFFVIDFIDKVTPIGGLFIIDDKGNLRQMTVNDLPVGRSVDETLRLVQAFQFTDKHGEGT